MVEITTKPENFTPIREGVVFVVNSDEETNFDIGIVTSMCRCRDRDFVTIHSCFATTI